MPRIPVPTPEAMSPEQRRVHDFIVGLRGGHMPAPYRTALHSPELCDKWQQMGELLRYRTSLPARLSELAVLVVARHHGCHYVWHAHAPVAMKAGVTAEAVEAIRAGQRPEFREVDEAAVHDYVKELLETSCVSEAVYNAALADLEVRGLVELTLFLGYYSMVALSLNAHGQPAPGRGTAGQLRRIW